MKDNHDNNMTMDMSSRDTKIVKNKNEKDIKINWELDFDDEKDLNDSKKVLTQSYNYVVVDIETTGFEPETSRIIEIVALRYDTYWNRLGTSFHNLLNPTQKIPVEITKLTGINQEMVKYKPYSKNGVLTFLKDLNIASDILIAHNAAFEFKWLKYQHKAFGLAHWVCTRGIYLYMRDGNTWENNFTKNYSRLKQVCEFYGIEYKEDDAHRAEYDVLKTQLVAKEMIAQLGLGLCLKISDAYIQGKGYGKRVAKYPWGEESEEISRPEAKVHEGKNGGGLYD